MENDTLSFQQTRQVTLRALVSGENDPPGSSFQGAWGADAQRLRLG